MKALVISGGGSKGAFAGGIAEYLLRGRNNAYDLFLGCSTGSLLVPLLSLGEIDRIKTAFTSVSQGDIFSNCPFFFKKEGNDYHTSINHWNVAKMFLTDKKTLGDSGNLKKLIRKIFTEKDFERMKSNRPDVMVTVSNMSMNEVEYKSVKQCSYADFCDWMWASANVVPFMSLMHKNGFEYADGGIGTVVPIYKAVLEGASEIDVILLKSGEKAIQKAPVRNSFEVILRIFDFMMNQHISNDLTIGEMAGTNQMVKLNIWQPPQELTNNPLIFDTEQMSGWWQQGFNYALNNSPISQNLEIVNNVLD